MRAEGGQVRKCVRRHDAGGGGGGGGGVGVGVGVGVGGRRGRTRAYGRASKQANSSIGGQLIRSYTIPRARGEPHCRDIDNDAATPNGCFWWYSAAASGAGESRR